MHHLPVSFICKQDIFTFELQHLVPADVLLQKCDCKPFKILGAYSQLCPKIFQKVLVSFITTNIFMIYWLRDNLKMKGADRFTLESRKRSLVRSSSSFISGYCLIFYILINLLSHSSAFSTNVFGCRPHVTALLAKHPDIEIDKTKARLLADFRTDDGGK